MDHFILLLRFKKTFRLFSISKNLRKRTHRRIRIKKSNNKSINLFESYNVLITSPS